MKQPIFLVMADTHAKTENIEEVYSIFEQAISLAKKKGIKRIIHLGDFLNNRSSQTLQVLLHFKKVLNLFSENNIELIGISGNHDRPDNNSEDAYVSIFEHY